jgi:hypothetical protein
MNKKRGQDMLNRLVEKAQRLLPYIAFGGGCLNVLFWVLYFANVIVLSEESESLVKGYESAFPFADALLGVLLMLAGIGLLKKRYYGTFFLIAAASMAVYLGVLDITFYGRQGMYFPLTASTVFAMFVNVSCIGGGLLGLWFGWKFWSRAWKTEKI